MTDSITVSAKDIQSDTIVAKDSVICCNPKWTTELNVSKITQRFDPTTNCRNCGAPLNKDRDCEYCGTKHQMKSEITMDRNGIKLSCG